jgi:membrane protease YdiL (CAAX protease family)
MTDPVFTVALALELTFVVAGLALLWRLKIAPAARRQPAVALLGKWNIPLSEFFLYLWLIVACAFGVLVGAGFGARHLPFGEAERANLTSTTAHVGAILGVFLFWRFFATRTSEPPPPPPRPNALRSGIATFLVALPIVYAVSFVWQSLLERCGIAASPQDLVGLLRDSKSPTFQALMIFAATVIVPVAEESLFRAGLFRYARHRLPRWVALGAPALLFGAMHANLASFAPLVALGLIFSLAYERTGRIGTAMVAHGLFNLHTVALIFAGVGT